MMASKIYRSLRRVSQPILRLNRQYWCPDSRGNKQPLVV